MNVRIQWRCCVNAKSPMYSLPTGEFDKRLVAGVAVLGGWLLSSIYCAWSPDP